MPQLRRHALAAALYSLVGGLATPRLARGEAIGYQLNRYEPVPAGDPFLVVEAPSWSGAGRAFAAALSFDYAYHLLVADPAAAPISHATSGHLDLAGALFGRVGWSLSVPLVIDQVGTAFAGVGPTGTTAGDPRLGVRARLYGARDGAMTLSAAAYLWIPIGGEDQLTGDAGARGLGRLTLGGVARDRVRWGINGSLLARRTAVLSATTAPAGNTVGSELQLGAAVGLLALDHRLSIGPEVLVSVALADLPASQDVATVEVFGGARYLIDDRFQLGLGVGTAVAGSGSPEARVLLSLTYAPTGVRGPSSSFERVIVLPDEDGHVGAVEVNDGKRKQLLDRAYASTELHKKDGKIRPVQSSAAKVAQGPTASVVRALPPPDRDGDGFVDAEDGCPDRAGLASADPIRRGCPLAAEKIVVLPDEDGHVGGVEVDDGHTVTVLDKPYASAEVDAGGTAHAVPSPSPRAIATVTKAIAQALPVADADDDTILDHDDACPTRAGVRSPDPIRNGCPEAAERIVVLPDPDGHVGGVEVDDGHGTLTVVDQAYASAEIGRDGVAHAVTPTTPRAVEHAIAAIALTLPLADSDADGTRDEADACPDRPGPASTDPLRTGCPVANEKVVVLPDADGHVGAVEIDDGQHTVLLDAAYATAE
ncbi:MAG: hypothetical protein NT062_32310, partial [Proteobacteria bacterium]|nr:hypothetical protein [Pseudomonadota bacterium]